MQNPNLKYQNNGVAINSNPVRDTNILDFGFCTLDYQTGGLK